MGEHDLLGGGTDDVSRRRVLGALGGTAIAATAGCTSEGGTDTPAPTATPTESETPEPTATETPTPEPTPQEQLLLEDIRETRENLTESEKRENYRSGIPSIDDYSLDFDRVQSENDTRREQLIDITATVGDQFESYVDGNHAVMNAISELDWMNWENDNIVNIVTRFNSAATEQITANYSTEDGDRNLDGTIASDSISGESTYIENIPDSEVMNGHQGNALVTDMETWADSIEKNNWGPENYKAMRLNTQSVIPGIKGPFNRANRDARDIGLVLDDEALAYIGESYDESAGLANEVSKEGLEIKMSTEEIRNSGRYVGVTAGEEGLEVDTIYSQEEGREKLREPVEL